MYYTVGEIARITGIPAHTLRYYDREGLLPGVLLLEGHEAGHLVLGQFDFFMAEVGESEVGYLVGEG